MRTDMFSEVALKSNRNFKMADRAGKHNKPSKESGNSMSWTTWAHKYGAKALNSCDTNDSNGSQKGYYEKKMSLTDMPMYGVCPASNQLSLIVCNHCGKSITPQGLLRHYELRHNYTPANGVLPYSSKEFHSVPSSASTTQELPSVSTSERLSSITSLDSCSPAPSPRDPPSIDQVDSPIAVPSTDGCARTCRALADKWSGKRKRQDQSPFGSSSKHIKLAAKQKWVDGLGHAGNSSASGATFDTKSAISPTLPKQDTVVSKSAKLDSVSEGLQKSVLKTAGSTKSKQSLSKLEVLPKPPVVAPISNLKPDVAVEPVSKTGNLSRTVLKDSTPPLSCDKSQSADKPLPASPTVKSQTNIKETVSSERTSKPTRRASRTKEKPQRDPNSLPCKDRMFDADIHCGVWIEDISRQCTHSLTCKIHSLSLRRAVSGRSRPFDVLLSDHRASKEHKVFLRNTDKTERTSKSTSASTPKLVTSVESDHMDNLPPDIECISEGSHLDKEVTDNVVSPLPPTPPRSWRSAWRARCLLRSARLFSILAPSRLDPKDDDSLTKPEKLLVFPSVEKIPVHEELGATSSDDEDGGSQTDLTTGFVAHQPRPLAVNGFGAWSVTGSGCSLFNRRELTCRWALNAIVDRGPPRHGSKSQSSMLDSSVISTTVPYCDRYDFIGKSNHSTMLSSQPPTLSPIKMITPKIMNSCSISIANNVYTDTSRCISLPTSDESIASNVADSLWRSSFVCITSTSAMSRPDGVGKDHWAAVSNERLVSSAATFQSPMRTFSADGHRQMSMSDKEQMQRSFHSPVVVSEPLAKSLQSVETTLGKSLRVGLAGSLSATAVNSDTLRTLTSNTNGNVVGESRATQNGRVLPPPVRRTSLNNLADTKSSITETSSKKLGSQNVSEAERIGKKSNNVWATESRSVERSFSLDVKSQQDRVATGKSTDRRLSNDAKLHSSVLKGQKSEDQPDSIITNHSLTSDQRTSSQHSLSKQNSSSVNKLNLASSKLPKQSKELCTSSNRALEDSRSSDKQGLKTLSKSKLDSHKSLVTNSSLTQRHEHRQLSVEKTSRDSLSTLPATNGLSRKNSHSSDSSSLPGKDQRSPAVITSSKHKPTSSNSSHKRIFDEDEDEYSYKDDHASHQNHHITSSVKPNHQRTAIAAVNVSKSFSQPSPKRHKSSSSKRRDFSFS